MSYSSLGNFDQTICTSDGCKDFHQEFNRIYEKIKHGEHVSCQTEECQKIKQRVYDHFSTQDLFIQYFNNPIMFKLRNNFSYSIYVSEMEGSFSTVNKRYIFAITPIDMYMDGSARQLDELPWISIQTRSLSEELDLPQKHEMNFNAKILQDFYLTPYPDQEEENAKVIYYYNDVLQINVVVLLDRPTQFHSYNREVPLSNALQSFKTTVTFATYSSDSI